MSFNDDFEPTFNYKEFIVDLTNNIVKNSNPMSLYNKDDFKGQGGKEKEIIEFLKLSKKTDKVDHDALFNGVRIELKKAANDSHWIDVIKILRNPEHYKNVMVVFFLCYPNNVMLRVDTYKNFLKEIFKQHNLDLEVLYEMMNSGVIKDFLDLIYTKLKPQFKVSFKENFLYKGCLFINKKRDGENIIEINDEFDEIMFEDTSCKTVCLSEEYWENHKVELDGSVNEI